MKLTINILKKKKHPDYKKGKIYKKKPLFSIEIKTKNK